MAPFWVLNLLIQLRWRGKTGVGEISPDFLGGVFIEFTSLPIKIPIPTSEIPPCERWLNDPGLSPT